MQAAALPFRPFGPSPLFPDTHTAAAMPAAALPTGPLCGPEWRNSPWP